MGAAGAEPEQPGLAPRAAGCGLDAVVWASVDLRDQPGLDALAGCERVAGNLTLKAFDGMDVTPLGKLRLVDGTVLVDATSTSGTGALAALSALEEAGAVFLQNLDAPDLTPLSKLRRIAPRSSESEASSRASAPDTSASGGLRIRGCNQLRDLRGLDALEQLDWLELFESPAFVSLEGLSRVSQLQRLQVSGSALSSLQGVEALHVAELSILDSLLTDLSGLGDASSLRMLALDDNPRLTSLQGARLPERMDSVLLSNDDALVDLRGLEGLRELIQLSLRSNAERPALASLSGLDALETVQTLDVTGFPLVENFLGLEALSQVVQLRVARCTGVSSLAGLSGLTRVGTLEIKDSLALSSLAGLASPSIDVLELYPLSAASLAGLERATLTGRLGIGGAEQLLSLDGLPPLGSRTELSLDAPVLEDAGALAAVSSLRSLALSNTNLTDLDALADLRQLESLYLSGNERLVQIDAVSEVSDLKHLTLAMNAALRTLPTFANVREEVCEDCYAEPFSLSLVGNSALETGPDLPGVEQAAIVVIEDNERLSSLLGFSALRSIGSLTVTGNAALTTLSLPNLTQAGSVRIRYNPVLDDTPLAPLESLPDGSIKIVSNLSGPAQLAVCPWGGDGECDELSGDCASGSDRADCFF